MRITPPLFLRTALACSMLSLNALGFEEAEHEAVSVLSLNVADKHLMRLHGSDPVRTARVQQARAISSEFMTGLRRGGRTTEVTFGHIVRLVDYVRDPYRMMHPSRTGSGWPTNSATCNLGYLETLH